MRVRFVLTIPGRPMNSNDRLHWRANAQAVKALRYEAQMEARAQWGVPRPLPTPVTVTVEHHTRTRRTTDTANIAPAVKAIIDAVVAAGWLPDDTPEFVSAIVFLPCVCTGRDEIRLTFDADRVKM